MTRATPLHVTELDAGYTGLHARQPRAAAILHTNGGPSADGSLAGWWQQTAASGSHVGAHYQVKWGGGIERYVDPALVIYHAYSASEFAIGIETQDDGDVTIPWTPEQMASIAAILRHHGVPAQTLATPAPADGVGFHQQFGEWNGSGHNCPAPVRVAQIPQVLDLLSALYVPDNPAPTGDDDMLTVMCSPGKHNPRLLPGGHGDAVGAVMGPATWSAYNELAAVGGAKIVTMKTQANYDVVVADLGGSKP